MLTEPISNFADLIQAINASICGITLCDARVPDLPIVYANRSFYSMTGYSEHEVIGKNCRFLQGTDKTQPELQTLRLAIQERRSAKVILRNYKKDGSLFWNELTVSPVVDEHGVLRSYIGVQNDVTKLVTVTKQRDDFIATLVHDIKNPIIGCVRVLEHLTSDPRPLNLPNTAGGAGDLLTLLRTTLDSTLQMTQSALEHYRLEQDLLKPIKRPTELSSLCCKILSEFSYISAAKQLELCFQPPPPLKIACDGPMIKRVLMNLLDNAVKHSPPGGVVRLTLERSEDLSKAAQITVSNPGRIAPEEVSMLFQKFGQTVEGRRRGGSGLGLYLCRAIITAHGGSIALRQANERIEITLSLPL